MDKEKQPIFESGFSEKQIDLAVDKTTNNDQTKSGNIFIAPKKKIKSRSRLPR